MTKINYTKCWSGKQKIIISVEDSNDDMIPEQKLKLHPERHGSALWSAGMRHNEAGICL